MHNQMQDVEKGAYERHQCTGHSFALNMARERRPFTQNVKSLGYYTNTVIDGKARDSLYDKVHKAN